MIDIDWNQAPDGAMSWAMNADGTAHWFATPVLDEASGSWLAQPMPAPTFGYSGDWRESFTERMITIPVLKWPPSKT